MAGNLPLPSVNRFSADSGTKHKQRRLGTTEGRPLPLTALQFCPRVLRSHDRRHSSTVTYGTKSEKER